MAKRKPKVSLTLNPFGIEPVYEKGKTPDDIVERRMAYANSSGWYNYESNTKDHASYVIAYAKNQLKYSAADIKSLKSLRDWEISSRIGIPCRMFSRGWEFNVEEAKAVADSIAEKLALAKSSKVEVEVTDEPKVRAVTPAQKAQLKVASTIAHDFDLLVDQFMQGNYKASMNAFTSAKSYSLNAQHINLFKKIVENEFDSLNDAFNKKCDQAVEGYSVVKRADLKKMHITLSAILEDLEQLKTVKVVRKTKKPQSADKQIRKLNFKTEDTTYKVASINPAMIPTRTVLWTFNTKTRFLTMYKADSVDGLSVKGTSIKGFNAALSKTTRLRKPNDVLPTLLKAKLKKVENVWDEVTTKITEPTGRVNGDVILLRAN